MRKLEWAGHSLPVIGQGTWGMGEQRARRTAEVDALRLGVSLGMTVLNTAEIYGAGGAEEVVGEAIKDCRQDVFVVTKVWPSQARAKDVESSVRASCQRMRTDHADLVLLHWPTHSVPLEETVSALRRVRAAGLARHVGVSNFDVPWLEMLRRCEEQPGEFGANEVPYSLGQRGIEQGVLQEAEGSGRLVLAYSPLAHGRYGRWQESAALRAAADAHGGSPLQVALAWTVQRDGVVAIPKAVSPEHVRANAAAGEIVLSAAEMDAIAQDFPGSRQPYRPSLPPSMVVHRLAYGAIRLQRRLRD